MPTQPLEAQVLHQPGLAVIELRGEINAAAETSLTAAYAEAEAGNPASIVVNFAQVDYINSTGIALIVGLLARARARQRRLVACGLSEHYVEIFALTRLADYMTVFSDEPAALAELTGAAQPSSTPSAATSITRSQEDARR
jgi:anti-anti-sigma factor